MNTRDSGLIGLGMAAVTMTALLLIGAGVGLSIALVDYYLRVRDTPSCERIISAETLRCYQDCRAIVEGSRE
jgi:hypothetical protein